MTSMSPEATPILVGQFDDFETARAVIDELQAAGCRPEDIEEFALNAPGQHDRNPAGIGGDRRVADEQTQGAEGGAAGGAALGSVAGLAVGVAAIPLAGPLAAGAALAAGAYVGSLAGTARKLSENTDETPPVPERPAGVRVAVRAPGPQDQGRVIGVFNRHHARSIEEARGTWTDGHWRDFDPVSPPRWVVPPPH